MTLHRFAAATAALAFFVLFAGGMVTSTGSGLAVPDWPLSFGSYFPRMAGGVFFEHGHRLVAGLVGLLTFALALWVSLRETRRWVRRAALAAAAGVVVQAVLGGATVLYGLPPQVSIAHACLGQALFCLLLAVAQATSPRFLAAAGAAPEARSLAAAGALAVAAVFLQLVLGAALRHTGGGLGLHLLGAVLAFWAVSRAAWRGTAAAPLPLGVRGLSLAAMLLVLAQLFLGVGALAGRELRAIGALALLPTLHQACGALILGVCVLGTLRAARSAA